MGSICVHAFQVELQFGCVSYVGRGNWSTRERPLGTRERTNHNKLNSHMIPGLGIEPEPHSFGDHNGKAVIVEWYHCLSVWIFENGLVHVMLL